LYQIKLPQITRKHLIDTKPKGIVIPEIDLPVDGIEDRFFIDGALRGMKINFPMKDIYKLDFFQGELHWDQQSINEIPWNTIESELEMIQDGVGNIVDIYFINGKFSSPSTHTILAYLLIGCSEFPCELKFDNKIPIPPIQNRINKAIRKFKENL